MDKTTNAINELSYWVSEAHRLLSESADIDPNAAATLQLSLRLARQIESLVDFPTIHAANKD